jgi:3-methyladenine DNA glycosylase AlkD
MAYATVTVKLRCMAYVEQDLTVDVQYEDEGDIAELAREEALAQASAFDSWKVVDTLDRDTLETVETTIQNYI